MSSTTATKEDLASVSGPYSLKPLLEDAGISADGGASDIHISCLEYWDGNLYIGTTAGEVLHFVSIPSDPAEAAINDTYILASRLEPSAATESPTGVRQIVILPRSNKACILCNGNLSFHSLPELSPAAGHKSLRNCIWIGAQDLNLGSTAAGLEEEDVIMITMRSRIRLVKLGKEQRPQLVRDIEYPGCLAAARRGRFACVANNQSYALLDVENQQQIPLSSISSQDRQIGSASARQAEGSSHAGQQHSRSVSAAQRIGEGGSSEKTLHSRASSLGSFVGNLGAARPDSRSRSRDPLNVKPQDRAGTLSPDMASSPVRQSSARGSPAPGATSSDKPLPPPPTDAPIAKEVTPIEPQLLAPHITSPLATEFLLTTGTAPDEPGVGIFVNCDGDVVRGTLEFSQYPSAVVLDGTDVIKGGHLGEPQGESDGYVLALIDRGKTGGGIAVEVQRWDISGEAKAWLKLVEAPPPADDDGESTDKIPIVIEAGITAVQSPISLTLREVGEKLRLRRFHTPNSNQQQSSKETKIEDIDSSRNQQEDEFAQRFGQTSSNIIAWSGRSISWAIRNPMLIKLDASIDQALLESNETRLDQAKLIKIIRKIRNQEAKSETEFLSLDYIRQKVAIVFFADLAINQDDVDPQVNEQLLLEGGMDPRVMLSMVPLLRKDIVEGVKGIWIHDGLATLMRNRFSSTTIAFDSDEVLSRPEEFDIVGLIKRYLVAWRQKKGFGSIADETQVFATVDAALIHILLHQDQQSNIGPGGSSSLRAELYAVVDHNVDCFDRAVELLESYKRLYVLSRLYQSRNMRGQVLATWRRILEGEKDEGGEFADGENEVRKYLSKTKDIGLVEEYGTWLAKKNPSLGVLIFTDDSSRVKLPPNQVVQLLRLRAPEAVKVYLEHIVFGKKNLQYANELISYYLDNVLDVLKSSEDARSTLSQSYETYRLLDAPRPTYREFITDNAVSTPWWDDRLRLLELLGGSHGAGFSYDVSLVLERIEPYEQYLVPESIILDGRQGRHQQALRLLVHALGDYHTAINYCLLGGSSIFHPATGSVEPESVPSRAEQTTLFKHLFHEFLRIEDASNRLDRTSELLGRFGSWFDVQQVLLEIPDAWSIELMSDFLVGAFRKLVQEKSEASITKSLRGAENLRISVEFVEKCEERGPHVVPAMDTPSSIM